ncbi:hypothetical protein HYX12_03400 [Candidatus Woesearchaeota archaeon]|nr:hypothetical protein [Candidatus Woesearchaeota archaeon]
MGLVIPVREQHREQRTIQAAGKQVKYQQRDGTIETRTLCVTGYSGDTFMLTEIHSDQFVPTPPTVEGTVRASLNFLSFYLCESGLATHAGPNNLIPALQSQLELLDRAQSQDGELRADIHHLLGGCYRYAENLGLARNHYDQALALSPQGRRNHIGNGFLDMGDRERAAGLFRDAILHDPVDYGLKALVPFLRTSYGLKQESRVSV